MSETKEKEPVDKEEEKKLKGEAELLKGEEKKGEEKTEEADLSGLDKAELEKVRTCESIDGDEDFFKEVRKKLTHLFLMLVFT